MVPLFDYVKFFFAFFSPKAKKQLGLYKRDKTSRCLRLTVESRSSLTFQSNTCSSSIAPWLTLPTWTAQSCCVSVGGRWSTLLQHLHMTLTSLNMMTWTTLVDPSLFCPPCEERWWFSASGALSTNLSCHQCFTTAAGSIQHEPYHIGHQEVWGSLLPLPANSLLQKLNADCSPKAWRPGYWSTGWTIRVEMGLLQKKVADGNLWDL